MASPNSPAIRPQWAARTTFCPTEPTVHTHTAFEGCYFQFISTSVRTERRHAYAVDHLLGVNYTFRLRKVGTAPPTTLINGL